jgi:paraquat-inducible protein A
MEALMTPSPTLIACDHCALVQRLPNVPAGAHAICARCGGRLEAWWHDPRLAAALSLSALVLFVPAVLLPMMRLETLGHAHEASIIDGVSQLLAHDQVFIGLVILVFSLVLPPVKLVALLLVSTRVLPVGGRARLYGWVELLGRWGMLDVLVVAVLIAFVKLGETVQIRPGPGLFLFAACVLVSLLASVCLHPPSLWNEHP